MKGELDKLFELKSCKPTLLERIKLLFVKEKRFVGEYGILYYYKEMNNKIFIIREIIPDGYFRFKGD